VRQYCECEFIINSTDDMVAVQLIKSYCEPVPRVSALFSCLGPGIVFLKSSKYHSHTCNW